jgi:hypothetical protein
MRADMEDPAINKSIDGNIELARAIGVTGTPTFIIGDAILVGAKPLQQMESAIAHARRRRSRHRRDDLQPMITEPTGRKRDGYRSRRSRCLITGGAFLRAGLALLAPHVAARLFVIS